MAAVLGAAGGAAAADEVVDRDLGRADRAYRVIKPDGARPAAGYPLVVYLQPVPQP